MYKYLKLLFTAAATTLCIHTAYSSIKVSVVKNTVQRWSVGRLAPSHHQQHHSTRPYSHQQRERPTGRQAGWLAIISCLVMAPCNDDVITKLHDNDRPSAHHCFAARNSSSLSLSIVCICDSLHAAQRGWRKRD